MSKRTTKNGVTTIKGRGVTIRVDDRQIEKDEAKAAAEAVKLKPMADLYHAAFCAFDHIETAKRRVTGTMQIMALILDEDREYDEGISVTLERWLKADLAALDQAFDEARNTVLGPLHSSAYPKAHPMGTTRMLAEVAGRGGADE